MRRFLIVLATAACCGGCYWSACVIERDPYGADLCEDESNFLLWEDTSEPGDPWYCSGEEHSFETCEGLGFTVHCGVFLIRPTEFCDQ